MSWETFLSQLPYVVFLITQWTSPLNWHWKMVPDDMQHLYICWYYHIWPLWSHNRHHHWIHIKKWFQMIYNTCIFAGITIYGHSNHTMDITIEFTLKNGSRWYITLAYLRVLPYMVTPITKWTLTKSKVPLHFIHTKSTGTPSQLNSYWKMLLGDDHIIYSR